MAGAFDLQHWQPLGSGLRTDPKTIVHATCVMRAYRDLQFAEHRTRAANNDVAGLDWTDAFRRSGINQITRIERVKRRGELDQSPAIEDQHLGVAVLPGLAIDSERKRQCVRIGNLVRGDHPWAEYGITIDGFAETAILAAAHRHIQAEAVAGDVVERSRARNVAAGFPDHHHQLAFVIVAALRE